MASLRDWGLRAASTIEMFSLTGKCWRGFVWAGEFGRGGCRRNDLFDVVERSVSEEISAVPSGLNAIRTSYPMLKHWAIVG